MNKYYGQVGFVTRVEDPEEPGVWIDKVETRNYYGDIVRNRRQWQVSQESTNDNVTISNQFSILADPFAFNNLQFIRFLEWRGMKWKVTSVDVEYPRLILEVGGPYSENEN